MKIYSIYIGYYCYDFVFTSRIVAVSEIHKFVFIDPIIKSFFTSELMILTLIKQL